MSCRSYLEVECLQRNGLGSETADNEQFVWIVTVRKACTITNRSGHASHHDSRCAGQGC